MRTNLLLWMQADLKETRPVAGLVQVPWQGCATDPSRGPQLASSQSTEIFKSILTMVYQTWLIVTVGCALCYSLVTANVTAHFTVTWFWCCLILRLPDLVMHIHMWSSQNYLSSSDTMTPWIPANLLLKHSARGRCNPSQWQWEGESSLAIYQIWKSLGYDHYGRKKKWADTGSWYLNLCLKKRVCLKLRLVF